MTDGYHAAHDAALWLLGAIAGTIVTLGPIAVVLVLGRAAWRGPVASTSWRLRAWAHRHRIGS